MFSARTDWNLSQNAYSLAADALRARGEKFYDLTVSNPTEAGFDYETSKIMSALANPNALNYEPAAKGLLPARQSVSNYYQQSGIQVAPDALILTVSTSEAYTYCFRLLCDPGDEVLVPVPSYPLFEFLAELQDVKLVPYELVYDHGWLIDFHSLEHAISSRTRAVLVVNPNNPTGSYAKPWEIERLNEVSTSHSLAIIADEVFLDYGLDSAQHRSFAENSGALTFTLSGLSKIAGLPQMKVAWLGTSGPESLAREAMARLEVIADTYLSMNAPIQCALPDLLDSRHELQRQLRDRSGANLSELDRQLGGQKLCSRLHVEGGWYGILRVPVTRSDEALAIALIESESVLVHPGHFYDFASDGHLVISLITPIDEFAEGVRRVLRLVTQHS
jgi:alanine-synthesizing transaminase